MSKVIFYNPHVHSLYSESCHSRILKYPNAKKFWYVMANCLHYEKVVNICIDYKETSLPFCPSWKWLRKIEFWIWCRLAGLNWHQVKLINARDVTETDQLILTIKNLNDTNKASLEKIRAVKILNTNHFMTYAQTRGSMAKSIGVEKFWSEARLDKSDFFTTYYGETGEVFFIPYVPQKRFRIKTPFLERKPRCVALGAIYCFCDDEPAVKDLREFFNVDTYHPARKMMFDNWRMLSDVVDVFVRPWRGRNHCLKSRDDPPVDEKYQYYDEDLVSVFNSYQLVIYGEEVNDMPALGMYEALKCGCVLVGSSHRMYSDIGLEAGVSYISYGAQIEPTEFRDLLRRSLSDQEKLREMSKRSLQAIERRISEEASFGAFTEMLRPDRSMPERPGVLVGGS